MKPICPYYENRNGSCTNKRHYDNELFSKNRKKCPYNNKEKCPHYTDWQEINKSIFKVAQNGLEDYPRY